MQLATLPQIRAARALLNWTQGDLAKAAKLSLAAVNNLERDASNPSIADTYRRQFEFFWEQSRDPPFTPTQLYEISKKLLPL